MPSVRVITLPLAACLLLPALAAGLKPEAVADQELPSPALPAASRGPVQLAFSSDGGRAFVTESHSGTLAVVDVAAGRVRRRFRTGGEQPLGVAVTASGDLLVANSFSGSVALLDSGSGRMRALLPLRGGPADVVLSQDARRAFVSLAELDEIAVLSLPAVAGGAGLRIERRVPVGKRPRQMALTPDGKTLVVANFQGGDVSVVDTAALKETRRIELTGVNLRGVAVSADGAFGYVTGQIPANTRATDDPLDIWTNTVFVLDLTGRRVAGSAEGWLDFTLAASPDPTGIVALGPERVAVTLSGCDQALLVRTPGPHLRTYDPVIARRSNVGAHPQGIAVTPDGKRVWVANELDSSITVLDAETLAPVRRIELGVPPKRDLRLPGRYLFGNARMTQGRQFTCDSCHPGGNTDGLDWEFTHVPDGLPRRNTRNLRGGITETAPFRWSGREKEIEEFFQDEITGLLHGPKQDHDTLHALWNLVDLFPMPPNPYRNRDGSLTERGRRGKILFEGKAACLSCHSGELRGGTDQKAYVGTTRGGLKLDVPHLHGVHDSEPYLHDGRARTLEEIFSRHNRENLHGKADRLTPSELADLAQYLREL